MEEHLRRRDYSGCNYAKRKGDNVEIKLRVKFSKDGREAVEYLKQSRVRYGRQAERAGLVFSMNWVDPGKTQPLTNYTE